MSSNFNSKPALLDRKRKILEALNYTEMRMEEVRARSNSCYYEEDSSDSEVELSLPDIGPSVVELKLQQNKLRTCSQATQELTGVTILQSEVTVVIDPPKFDDEPPVKEEGTWREVTAECRVNNLPFSINFHVHRPDRQFASCAYRGLRVLVVKVSQEAELARSVLHGLTRPADAVQVVRSYAMSYRSRRASLARLAERYGSALHMEPYPEGGFVLMCAGLLEVTWQLENKSSPVAPFHHCMKFNLEYLDEEYIKIISQAHKQLSDPTLDTDERTLLLSQIISTCLEAQGRTQEPYESLESDQESIKRNKTILDQEFDDPPSKKQVKRPTAIQEEREEVPAKKMRDTEVMAPPKSLPKKMKPKGKENTAGNKAVKRASSNDDVDNVKKAKIDAADRNMSGQADAGKTKKFVKEQDLAKEIVNNNVNKAVENKVIPKKSAAVVKQTKVSEINKKKTTITKKSNENDDNALKNDKTTQSTVKVNNVNDKNVKLTEKKTDNIKINSAKAKTKADNDNKNVKNVNKDEELGTNNPVNPKLTRESKTVVKQKEVPKKTNVVKKITTDEASRDVISNANPDTVANGDQTRAKNTESIKSNDKNTNRKLNKIASKVSDTKTNDKIKEIKSNSNLIKKLNHKLKIDGKVTQNTNKVNNLPKQKSNDKTKPDNNKIISAAIKKNVPAKNTDNTTIQRVTEKNAIVKNNDNLRDIVVVKDKVKDKAPLKIMNRYSITSNKHTKDSLSKIPQKATVSSQTLKKNPLRISPRKIMSKVLSPTTNAKMQKATNIPRLMKKSVSKS